MNKLVKQIMVAALAVTTMGAGTTTQVQASDFGKTLLGVAAAGIIIHEIKKDRAHKSRSSRGHEVRSHQRKRYHSSHHGHRHHSRHGYHGGHRGHHAYRH